MIYWGWDLRTSCRIYDGTGSIKMVLAKDIASKVLQKNLSELIVLSNQRVSNSNQFKTSLALKITVPELMENTGAQQ